MQSLASLTLERLCETKRSRQNPSSTTGYPLERRLPCLCRWLVRVATIHLGLGRVGEKGGTELSAASLSFMSLKRAAEGGGGAQHAPRMRSSESRGMIDLDLVLLLD